MKWASNGELSTHDIHKLLSKMSQAQAFARHARCLEPTKILKYLHRQSSAELSISWHRRKEINLKLNKKYRNASEQVKSLSDPKVIQ